MSLTRWRTSGLEPADRAAQPIEHVGVGRVRAGRRPDAVAQVGQSHRALGRCGEREQHRVGREVALELR
jgi:hypothetical protein